MNQILIEVAKAILITAVSSLAAVLVEKIRRHNQEERDSQYHYQPEYDEHEYW